MGTARRRLASALQILEVLFDSAQTPQRKMAMAASLPPALILAGFPEQDADREKQQNRQYDRRNLSNVFPRHSVAPEFCCTAHYHPAQGELELKSDPIAKDHKTGIATRLTFAYQGFIEGPRMKDWISDEEKERDERRWPLHLLEAIIATLIVGFGYFTMFKSLF